MIFTKEDLDGIGSLIDLMRSKGVINFNVNGLAVTLGAEINAAQSVLDMSTEDKLNLLKEELKSKSKEADEDFYWSV